MTKNSLRAQPYRLHEPPAYYQLDSSHTRLHTVPPMPQVQANEEPYNQNWHYTAHINAEPYPHLHGSVMYRLHNGLANSQRLSAHESPELRLNENAGSAFRS